MGVDHRGLHVGVTKKLLYRSDVGARLEQVSGEAVTKGMAARRLTQMGTTHRVLHVQLHLPWEHVRASPHTGARIDRRISGRKYILPTPVEVSPGIFASQRVG